MELLKQQKEVEKSTLDEFNKNARIVVKLQKSLIQQFKQEGAENALYYELTYPYKKYMLEKISQTLGDRKEMVSCCKMLIFHVKAAKIRIQHTFFL